MTAPQVRDDLASLEAGLDALDAPAEPRRPAGRRVLSALWPPLGLTALLLVVWELLHRAGAGGGALPAPGQVGRVLLAQLADGTLVEAVGTSVWRGGLGFLVAVAVGTPLGLLVARVGLVRRAVGPFLAGLQSLPSVAFVPATVLLLGTGEAAVYAVVLLGAVPSIATGMMSGLAQVPPLYHRVAQVLGARGLTAARHVLLPAALPGYVAGLRQGWAFSWRALMAAELIVTGSALGEGLGQLLARARAAEDLSLVLAGIAGILVVGLAVELLVFGPLERRVLRRRGLLLA